MKKNELMESIRKDITLKTRLQVEIESYYLMKYNGYLMLPLDKNFEPIQECVDYNNKCLDKVKPLIDKILNCVDEWEKDNKNN